MERNKTGLTRERDGENGSLSACAPDGDGTFMLFNDLFNHEKAEAGSFFFRFGGKHGLENTGQDVGGDAFAGVGNRYNNLPTGFLDHGYFQAGVIVSHRIRHGVEGV